MAFDLQKFLNDLLPVLGQAGVDTLKGELDDLAAGQEGWQQTVLAFAANSVEEYGPKGIDIAMESLNKLFDGEEVDISWADLEVASDLLAHLQNAEADAKSEWQDFVARLSHTLGTVLGALIRGLASS